MNQLLKCTKKFSTSSVTNKIKNVTVIGARVKGTGIAQVTAQAGQNVILIDSNPDLLKKAKEVIHGNLYLIAQKYHKDDPASTESFVKETMGRIKTFTKLEDGLKADLIIEDVIDELEIKQELFSRLDQETSPCTILASNPTSLSVNAIGAGIKLKNRYGGLHFFNPVPVMRLLEVIKSDQMCNETYQAMLSWGKSIGKTCITCKDTPGFIVNRLLIPYGAEALRMYERGDASKEDIDIAMKLGASFPMGPFELIDYTGLDNNKIALEHMYEMTKDPVFHAVPILDKMVVEVKLGVKSGEGFYKYKKDT